MNIYGISDLHLSSVNPKPMDVFGDKWSGHWEKIKSDWRQKVRDEDIVLIPGDISWALTLSEALPDILDISSMPGKKILSRGNHDYWWSSYAKMRREFPEDIEIIQNSSIELENYLICGTRGWILPGDERFGHEDEKIYKRELERLRLSLTKASNDSSKPILVMLHYPPFNERKEPSEFIDLMGKYNVKSCIYGHLHGESLKGVTEGNMYGINFYMVSCDYLDFKLRIIEQ